MRNVTASRNAARRDVTQRVASQRNFFRKETKMSAPTMIDFKLHGISPISFSKVIQSTKTKGETDDAFEQRTWKERIHQDDKGQVVLPGVNLKNCLADCAVYFGEKIKGKGMRTWTKHFEAGIMIVDAMPMFDDAQKPVMAKDVPGERLWLNSDGQRGGGKRVWRTYPYVVQWNVSGIIHVFDPTFDGQLGKIKEYLEHAGQFVGLGRWRPRNRGMYGRFEVVSFKS